MKLVDGRAECRMPDRLAEALSAGHPWRLSLTITSSRWCAVSCVWS
jgi:hypothetical protein